MCNHCVIQSVKDRMLNRRTMLKAGLTGAAALSTGLAPSSNAQAQQQTETPSVQTQLGNIVDLTHTLSPEFPTYFGAPGISYEQQFNFKEHGFNLFQLSINEHTATHIDAPLHFSADGKSVDEIEPSDLVAPLVVIDIREKADRDADAQVTPDDINAWVAKHGPLPEKCCVAMNSGWSAKAGSEADFTGRDADKGLHFPGFHVEATTMLLEQSSAVAMAVDTLSLDHGPSSDFATHYAWLPAGRYGIECLANLNAVPDAGATIIVGAPKTKGGTGGPARIFAAA
ncbi:MAG: cyclase family protein [Rhizobiaceae bacterium]